MYEGRFYLKDALNTAKLNWGFRESGFPFSGIYLFTGGQGTGKTLNAVQFVLDVVAKYPECIIISNMPLNIDGVIPYTGLDCLEKYSNGNKGIILFLDEIQSMYSSNQSKGVDDSALYVWAQNRKNYRLIVATSQRFSRVAKPIREQTKYLYDMRGKFINLFSFREYDGYNFDDEGNYCDERPRLRWCMPSLKAYETYDTRNVIKWKGDKLNG